MLFPCGNRLKIALDAKHQHSFLSAMSLGSCSISWMIVFDEYLIENASGIDFHLCMVTTIYTTSDCIIWISDQK